MLKPPQPSSLADSADGHSSSSCTILSFRHRSRGLPRREHDWLHARCRFGYCGFRAELGRTPCQMADARSAGSRNGCCCGRCPEFSATPGEKAETKLEAGRERRHNDGS
jgi:hypothetical protein